MRKKTILICAVILSLLLCSACGNKASNDDIAPSPSPTADEPAPTATENSGFSGKYELKDEDDTLTVTITPGEGEAAAERTEVKYTFNGEKIIAVSYESQYPDADTAKKAGDELKAQGDSYSNVSVSGNTVTYDISNSAMALYEGMTRQDITELTKILSGNTAE